MTASLSATPALKPTIPRLHEVLRNDAERWGMEWQTLPEAADHDGRVH